MAREQEMKIYHLHPIDLDRFTEKYPENTWGAVVVAPNQKSAREVASQAGGNGWLDEAEAECEELIADEYEVPCLILDDAD